MRVVLAGFLLLTLLFSSLSAAAQDDDGPELRWDPHWHKVHWVEYPLILTMLTYAQWGRNILPRAEENFTGGILLDDAARDLLRLHDRSARDTAGAVSDWVWYLTQYYSTLVDIFVVALGVHGNPDVAWNMFWVHAEALGFAAVVGWTARRVSGRQRPSGVGCATDPDYASDCSGSGNHQSFYSGHVALALTGAGLTCADHENLPLYGSEWADRITCYVAIAAGTAIGVLRIMTDKHYLSDVLVGAAVGVGAGYLWPSLVRYAGEPDRADPQDGGEGHARRRPGVRAMVVPWATEDAIGAQVIGTL